MDTWSRCFVNHLHFGQNLAILGHFQPVVNHYGSSRSTHGDPPPATRSCSLGRGGPGVVVGVPPLDPQDPSPQDPLTRHGVLGVFGACYWGRATAPRTPSLKIKSLYLGAFAFMRLLLGSLYWVLWPWLPEKEAEALIHKKKSAEAHQYIKKNAAQWDFLNTYKTFVAHQDPKLPKKKGKWKMVQKGRKSLP